MTSGFYFHTTKSFSNTTLCMDTIKCRESFHTTKSFSNGTITFKKSGYQTGFHTTKSFSNGNDLDAQIFSDRMFPHY